MTIQEELKRLRLEASDVRRRIATVERAWHNQTERAEQWEHQAKQLDTKNKQLERENQALEEKVNQLDEENKALKASLAGVTLHKDKLIGMIFKISHKPTPPADGAERRSLGGQPGHVGHGRQKPLRIDAETRVFLTHCPECQSRLTRSSSAYERIVEDIVVPAVTTITKYSIERQHCSNCQTEVHGTPINTLPGFRLGTRALTLILFLKYRLRLPLEKIRESLKEQYDLKIRAGALTNILHKLSQKLTPEYQRIIEEMRSSPVKQADETSWRIAGRTGWCWVFLSPTTVAYTMEETRGKGVPDKILGSNPSGVLVRDDYASYAHLPMAQQSCWAHLLRNSRDALKQPTVSLEMKQLHTELTGLYAKLATVVAKPFDQPKRTKQYAQFFKKIMLIIKRRYRAEDVKKIQTRITNQGKNLITALIHPHVSLTNNAAERQMRPVAIVRKISGGSRSNQGAKAQAVNMSIMQTIAIRGQSYFQEIARLLAAPGLGGVGKN